MGKTRLNWQSIGCTAVLAIAGAVEGATIYVDARVTSSGDGVSNWAAAKKTVQEAVNAAGAGDVVRVAGRIPDLQASPAIPGLIYTPTNQSSGYIELKSGVRIEGGYRGNDGTSNNPNDRDPATFVTILSGDLGGGVHAHHVVVVPSFTQPPSSGGVSQRVNLDGFTITGGRTPNTSQFPYGAGILILSGGSQTLTTPVFRNCIIEDNAVDDYEQGGGVFVQGSAHPVFRKCTFRSNYAGAGGAALFYGGNAGTFLGCTFDSNQANAEAGAVWTCRDTLGINFVGCTFINNEAKLTYGGAIVYNGSPSSEYKLRIENCLFVGNSAAETGGAIMFKTGSDYVKSVITNCTFTQNSREIMEEPSS